jgi:hypothetical protein
MAHPTRPILLIGQRVLYTAPDPDAEECLAFVVARDDNARVTLAVFPGHPLGAPVYTVHDVDPDLLDPIDWP